MIGCDAHMRCAVLDHLERALKHACDGAERAVLAFIEASQTVEVPKELVRAVDEMNDHEGGKCIAKEQEQ
jgi:hypothetical protein